MRNQKRAPDAMIRPSFMPGFGFGKKAPGAGRKGLKLEHRIGVQAPPDVIWELIADVRSWPDWNPLYSRAEGVLRIGAPLELTLRLPDLPERHIEPVVLEWVPNEQLHWRSSVAGGFGAAIRYIEIEQVADSACIFSN
ncbi:MAG TPA: SRPBCC domain-containing protein, partial [Phenylobacterium sp.]|nr:SRPBCC domain-containing protein [Phenylobacterium sp.]